MERREFLKTSCGFCVSFGLGIAAAGLNSCAPSPVVRAGRNGNSTTVGLSLLDESNVAILRVEGVDYDIALRRKGSEVFALLLRCTHSANRLVFTGGGFSCSLHGSKFDDDGVVQRGPAEQSLQELPVSVNGSSVVITLP